MNLGETNCNVTLSRCRKDTCYSFRDLSNQLPTDALTLPTTGLFASISIISGASKAKLTREGFSFQATSDTVTLSYSTKARSVNIRRIVHSTLTLLPCLELQRFLLEPRRGATADVQPADRGHYNC